jgi:O-methyltransferase involved in polyketide biosynthesis
VKGIDTSVPNIARVYDCLLGGKDHFEVDRAQAAKLVEFDPSLPVLVRQNREFVIRAVTWAVENGIDQFLDLGAGLPTHPAVHEAVRAVNPRARVVYVDNDPVVVLHAQALLSEPGGVTAVRADLTHPEETLASLDRQRPVCVILASVLHFMAPDVASDLVRTYAGLLAPGSVLIVSTIGADDPATAADARNSYTASPTYTHMRDDITAFLADAGLVLQEPGVVLAHEWRADTPNVGTTSPSPVRVLAAVGRLPG